MEIGGNEGGMKLIVFGTGRFYENRKHYLKGDEVLMFFDNAVEKQESLLEGKRIISPQRIDDPFDFIVIMSKNEMEMRRQLWGLGIVDQKIINFEQYRALNGCGETYFAYPRQRNFKTDRNYFLFLLEKLDDEAMMRELIRIHKKIQQNGKEMIVMSRWSGWCREILVKNGIFLMIDHNITPNNRFIWKFLQSAEKNIVMSITFSDLADEFSDLPGPVVFWNWEDQNLSELVHMERAGIEIYGVSEKCVEAMNCVLQNRQAAVWYPIVEDYFNARDKKVIGIAADLNKRTSGEMLCNMEKIERKKGYPVVMWVFEDENSKEEEGDILKYRRKNLLVEEKKQIYARISCFLDLDAVFDENLLIPELLGAGVVCGVTEKSQYCAMIHHEKNGYIIDPKDRNQAETILRDVAEENVKMSKLQEASRMTYLHFFNDMSIRKILLGQ